MKVKFICRSFLVYNRISTVIGGVDESSQVTPQSPPSPSQGSLAPTVNNTEEGRRSTKTKGKGENSIWYEYGCVWLSFSGVLDQYLWWPERVQKWQNLSTDGSFVWNHIGRWPGWENRCKQVLLKIVSAVSKAGIPLMAAVSTENCCDCSWSTAPSQPRHPHLTLNHPKVTKQVFCEQS
jgi:hypothetical protein